MQPVCKIVESKAEMDAAHAIRDEVFVKGQAVPPEIEWDEYEDTALHLICNLGDRPVGAGRITFFGDKAKVERVAVLEQFRNQGIGTEIVRFQLEICRKHNSKSIYAHVQLHAKEFYAKLGFEPVGEIFLEADIEHVKMIYRD
jgi:predicted GNAT family N-acyltransferase